MYLALPWAAHSIAAAVASSMIMMMIAALSSRHAAGQGDLEHHQTMAVGVLAEGAAAAVSPPDLTTMHQPLFDVARTVLRREFVPASNAAWQ